MVIADHDVPAKVLAFIEKFVGELLESREKLLMLLTLFCEQRLIPPDHIVTCMKHYDSLKEEYLAKRPPPAKKLFADVTEKEC